MGEITIVNGQQSRLGEKLIATTISNFDPIQIDGGGTDRRAIYVTLSKRNMLYQRSSEPMETEAISSIEEVETQSVTEDTIILASTDHLVVYEGAAVMAYPFKEAKESIFYRIPRGFVGRIEYDREPCELVPVMDASGNVTGEVMSVQKWDECTEGTKAPRPTVNPTIWVKPTGLMSPPPTKMPTEKPVPAALTPNEPVIVGVPTTSPILSPTASPSISIPPTIFIMKSYLIITFNNIRQGRVMDAREQNSFEKSIVSFLNRQGAVKANEVDIQGANIWYQQTYTTEEREQAQKGKKKRPSSRSNNNNGDGRVLQEGGSSETTAAEAASEESSISDSSGQLAGTDLIVPSPPAAAPLLEVTVIISVESSPLPQKITSQLFETMIRNSKTEFLASLKDVGALSDLFARTNDIPIVLSVERVTTAPTMRPTRDPMVEVGLEEDAPGLFSSTLMIILLVVGLVWIGLVFVTFSKIKKARRIMKIQYQRRFLGEDSFKAPYHGMVYDDEKKKNAKKASVRSSGKGMRASLLGSFGGTKKSSFLSKSSYKADDFKDNEDYSEGDDYESKEDMSSIEESYSSEEDLSIDGSSSGSY